MTDDKRRTEAWAAKKAAGMAEPLPADEAEKLRLIDAILDSFRVTVAGVDVTRWTPQLPPELKGKKPAQ